MFAINEDLSIYVTRGDILFFKVTADDKGKAHKFQPGDVVRMTVFEKKACNCVVIQKDFPVMEESEFVEIFLSEEETRLGNLISKPVDYWYEVELNPRTNPQTIVGYDENGAKVFKLFPEGNKLDEPVPDILPEDIPIIDEELDLLSPRPVQNRVVSAAIIRIEERAKRTEENTAASINAHTQAKDNPHGVTKEQVGLGNVPDVATNDQTPTYSEAEVLEELTSGEKMSAAFSKLKKAVGALIAHLGNKNNPHEVTAEQVKARPDTWFPSASDIGAAPVSHAEDTNNPHKVTAEQVKARPDTWMPTAEDVGATPSDHAEDFDNPHNVTAEQAGARPDTWLPTPEEINAVGKEGSQEINGDSFAVNNTTGLGGARYEGKCTIEGKEHAFDLGCENGVLHLRHIVDGEEKAKIAMQGEQTHMSPALAVAGGGTGGTTKEAARVNLGFTCIDLLWENDQWEEGLAEKGINLDLSAYEGIFVHFNAYSDKGWFASSGFIPKLRMNRTWYEECLNFVSETGSVLTRSISFTNGTISIGDGYKGETKDSKACVPVLIYGIKIGGGST